MIRPLPLPPLLVVGALADSLKYTISFREWEWEWQLSSDSSASMLAVAPSVYRLFMVGRDKVPNVRSYKLLGPKLVVVS